MPPIKLGVFSILGLALVLACGDEDAPSGPGPEGTDLRVPLLEGATWIFDETTDPGISGSTVVREVRGSWNSGDVEFAAVIDSSNAGRDSVYYALRGDEFLAAWRDLRPVVDVEETRLLETTLGQSLPWIVADFGAAPGTLATLAFLDTTVEVSGLLFEARLDVRSRFVGRERVETPAGTWEDARRFQVESVQEVEEVSGLTRFTGQDDFWLVEGLGWVREERFETREDPGGIVTSRRVRLLRRHSPPGKSP